MRWTLGHNLLFGPRSIMDKSKFKTNSFITQFVSVNFLLSLNVWSECISKEFTIEIYEVDNCLTLIGLPFLGCVAKTHKNLALSNRMCFYFFIFKLGYSVYYTHIELFLCVHIKDFPKRFCVYLYSIVCAHHRDFLADKLMTLVPSPPNCP